jgi:pimeloyl-ACP methyl ester carboxylesterase
MNLQALAHCNTDVLLLAGLRDHTADVRIQQPLAAHYPHARVVVLDDDHVFSRLGKSGLYRDLVAAFASEGTNGERLAGVLAQLAVVMPPLKP